MATGEEHHRPDMRALLGSDILVLVASYTPTSFQEALTEAEKAKVAKELETAA